ncbi:TPA: hypothetical protein N0F65_000159 [Lagenidium giganteum]|uniref:YbaK/aminoacyl-tRNA synthetase-associated domain-containing protein n=1 Tax=Lagenidium giganteum TaxID=4803 RepID=A0AAV2YTG0_9STRA|nr:TPA: hypothetical protein N0F65_000159 [Lagenidium giganteum]
MATIEIVQTKLSEAKQRLEAMERKLQEREAVERVRAHLLKARVSSAALKLASADYYSWKLAERAQFLGCQVPQLCKSIVMENTACTNDGIADPRNSRYYCVILQYNSKMNSEQLMRYVRTLLPENERPGRKAYNFQHAPGEVSDKLTGFLHNGVSPFGMKTAIPVLISSAVAQLNPPFIWLGGGAENVKLRIGVAQLIDALNARVVDDLTTLRDDL